MGFKLSGIQVKCILYITGTLLLSAESFFTGIYAQDTLNQEWVSFHFQTTIIDQYKPAFKAPYSGDNSLQPQKDNQLSVTATLYAGVRLWKYASVFVNPEMAGGSGLSGALGVGASTNGETFRVGDPKPSIYLARLYFEQLIPIGKKRTFADRDMNQLARYIPEQYISLTAGKLSMADYFDGNFYSHDPRTQFLSWGLMSNAAWDYPANVRGYTPGIVLQFISPKWEVRYGAALMPKTANGDKMNWDVKHSLSQTLEAVHNYTIHNRVGHLRVLGFYTYTGMGNYLQSLRLSPDSPDVMATRRYGRNKFGWGVSFDQELTDYLGMFMRFSWNDGRNETWAFTEIDRSISGGIVVKGSRWKRNRDEAGIALVISGLSDEHRKYVAAGGKGFILGDGRLNYGPENVFEFDYKASLYKDYLFLSVAYQLVLNPGYNIDRGPVNVFSVRLHAEI
jgi:high affinity Mn2+ porin